MGVNSQPVTFLELYTDLINRVREQTNSTPIFTQAKRYINIAHQDLYVGNPERFPWAERRGTLTTNAGYSDGTVSVTRGSTTVTGSGTLFDTLNGFGQGNVSVGGKLRIAGSREVYEVVDLQPDDITLTIEPAYIGETASGVAYQYFEDEYDLASDFLRLVDAHSFDSAREIRVIGRQDFRRLYPQHLQRAHRIRHAAILDLARRAPQVQFPRRRVVFGPTPSETRLIAYHYVTSQIVLASDGAPKMEFTQDTDEPVMPPRYTMVIVLHALRNWYRDRKDDARSLEVDAELQGLRARMRGDLEVGQQNPQLRPAAGAYRMRARRPWRGVRRTYDTGWFDTFEDP